MRLSDVVDSYVPLAREVSVENRDLWFVEQFFLYIRDDFIDLDIGFSYGFHRQWDIFL